MEEQPTTPGVLGYVLAFGVAVVLFSVPMGYLLAVPGNEPEAGFGVLEAIITVAVFAGILGAPLALVTVPLGHLLCRDDEAQGFHVVVAGLVGALDGLAGAVFFTGEPPAMIGTVLLAAGSAVAGRALVIPLVGRRLADLNMFK